MLEVLSWYAIISLVGWLTLPFTFLIFRRLPERGYSFSKPLGLLVVSLIAWWLGNLKVLPFVQLSCWAAVLVLALLVNFLLRRRQLYQDMQHWFTRRYNLKFVIVSELLFLVAFAFMLNARSFLVDTHPITEKFFNLAFINAIVTSPNLPPPDPWFGGQPMNYYYGGHLLIAVLCKLSGVGANVGYNLGLGLIFAMTVQGCFGLATNLVGLAKVEKGSHKGVPVPETEKNRPVEAGVARLLNVPLWPGLLAAAFIMVLGNLAPLFQVLKSGLLPLGNPDFPFKLDWFETTRLIFDHMPDGRVETILTEYPISSYLKGDLHAYTFSAPYIVLVLGLALHVLVAPGKFALARLHWTALPGFLIAGMLLGALNFTNGVDFPTFMGLFALLLGLAEIRGGGKWYAIGGRWLFQLIGVVAATKLVYIFYSTDFGSMLKAQPLKEVADTPVLGFLSRFVGWISWPRTNLSEYLIMFGLFLLPILTFYLLRIGELWQTQKIRLILEGLFVLALLVVGPLVGFELLGPLLFLSYFSVRLIWHDLRVASDKSQSRNSSDIFALVFVLIAGGLVLFSELFYVRDVYNNRYNTVFKFWYQAWVLYGFAAAYATWRVLNWRTRPITAEIDEVAPKLRQFIPPARRKKISVAGRWSLAGLSAILNYLMPRRLQQQLVEESEPGQLQRYLNSSGVAASPSHTATTPTQSDAIGRAGAAGWLRLWKWGWVSLLAALMLVASLVPTLGYWQETDHYSKRVGLEGEAWYGREYPAEYPAMRWFRDYIRQDASRYGIVLEANAMNYSWGNHLSTYIGLPTVVGWPFHELQWRGYLNELQIWQPWLDMDKIYETTDSAQALELLKKYNVRYVFVGEIENGTCDGGQNSRGIKKFSPEALAKFHTFMKTIYADPDNNIYIYMMNEVK